MFLKSVKARFLFIVIVALLSMIILIFSLKFSLDKLSIHTKIDKHIEIMYSQILQLRKDEKNFFIRRDLQYLDEFDKDIQIFKINANKLKNELLLIKFRGKTTDEVMDALDEYNNAFKNISKAYIKRGLTHNDGLRGKLRNDAHKLENILNSKPNLLILLLQMRKAEKDFFSRKQQSFADTQIKYYLLLKKELSSKKELLLLENYEDSFQKSYNLRIKIGIDNSHGYVQTMLRTAQMIEARIDKGTKKINPIIKQERKELKQLTYTIFFITAFVLLILIFSSAQQLSASFDKFIRFFKEAKNSYSHLDEKKASFAEFSTLSIYANEMIDARINAEDDLHDLNMHLEERVKDGIQEIQELNKEIVDTQKEVVFTMGAIGESRSKETGNHVRRVAQYSYILAKAYGLSQHKCDVLKEASPMHDIGKIAIPDAILNKPGSFNHEERAIIETHAQLGYDMLKHSKRELLLAASIVSYEHHEKYNGTGYPRGIKGEDIHIYGRITALADVFDALGSDRCYKEAWPDEKIFKMFKEERGKHFDPKLMDCFFENIDKFLEVRDKYKDAYKEV